ncbi:hypothetical protein BN8_p06856 (plasmid) [Fibrisoma limi BUZ 3]|uniref:Glycosyltransferase 61 catalytic domain-containing protein n=1 Tax=Fibrisoma limi BUZ 3 TaxID=1185876 RepID=I2GU52_9BACT|nr:glycosyltransferase family 61 protein [Fibrisoma limi]CCH57653.1 hypothetical protein BN8_p06856 [Fibrisoma limi BUZ 3]
MKHQLTTPQAIQESIKRVLGPRVKQALEKFAFSVQRREQTNAFLSSFLVIDKPGGQLALPTVTDLVDAHKVLFHPKEAQYSPTYVWLYEQPGQKIAQLPCGSIRIKNTILSADIDHDFYRRFIERRFRQTREVETLIAPWSHYFHEVRPRNPEYGGIRYRGYFDYIITIAAKLCRIKDAVGDAVFAESVVAYPLLDTAYEHDILALLGFKNEQIINSRYTSVNSKRCVMGNTDNIVYPSSLDIMALKKHIQGRVSIGATKQSRIYISRQGGRRIVNEDELIQMLQQFGFVTIEDKPRSIVEQVSIYANASFIIGPHGASFTNVIWCQPGTHLVELFSANYVPDYFLYLCTLLGLRYSAYCQGTDVKEDRRAILEDVLVSIPDLERRLRILLEAKTELTNS